MAHPDPAVQVEAVIRLERELCEARKQAAKALRQTREEKHIPLRAAAKGIRLSPGSLSKMERGHTWESKTALRAVRYLERAG